ncbi:MAG: CRISPR-associated endonuclease Cas2 [Myxococcales bacterium]|nr:CRISPR-associated endonuclease Cas2 [Myxococcales bacterium]
MLIVSYDIPNDRRRTKLAKTLLKVGSRVQYSVFVVERATVTEVAGIIRPIIKPREDNVRIHPICLGCHGKAVLLGRAAMPRLPEGFRIV